MEQEGGVSSYKLATVAKMLTSPSKTRAQHLATQKAKEIEAVLRDENVDLWKLRGLAISEGGLVNGSFTCELKHHH